MKAFVATVKYACGEPKDFGHGKRVNVVFEPEDARILPNLSEKYGIDKLRVNADANTDKHHRLRDLKKGQRVYLVKAGTYEDKKDGKHKPYFDVLEGLSPNGQEAEAPPRAEAADLQRGVTLMTACYSNLLAAFHGHDPLPNEETLGKMAISLFITLTDK